MCRLLAIASRKPLDARSHLDAFRQICAESREFQGDGWGCAAWRGGWDLYRTVRAVWDDAYAPGGEVRVLLAHARSAFRDEGVEVERNMPFVRGERAFAFNGELRGVRLSVEGRTGAEKIQTLIHRQDRGGIEQAIARATSILAARTARIRACNFVLAEPGRFHVHSRFDGEEDYFTLWVRRRPGEVVVCSQPYPGGGGGWTSIPNGSLGTYDWGDEFAQPSAGREGETPSRPSELPWSS